MFRDATSIFRAVTSTFRDVTSIFPVVYFDGLGDNIGGWQDTREGREVISVQSRIRN